MLVYNITIKADHSIAEDWIKWQQEENIPEMMATHLFTNHKFFKLLYPGDDEGATYVLQFYIVAKENYDRFIKEYENEFAKKSFNKWGNKFIAFKSLLEAVQ